MKLQNVILYDPEAALEAASKILKEPHFPDFPNKPGCSYYNRDHGERVITMVARLLKIQSRIADVSTIQLSVSPRTLAAQFNQGHQWLIDGGLNKLNCPAGATEYEWLEIKKYLSTFATQCRKMTVRFSLSVPTDVNVFDFLTPVQVDDSPTAAANFDKGKFREEYMDFINTAELDTRMQWDGVPSSEANWAENLAIQDDHLVFEYVAKTSSVTIMKLSEETKRGLEG
jgi:hypothetical protein